MSQYANQWENITHGYQKQSSAIARKGRQVTTSRESIIAIGTGVFENWRQEQKP